MNHEKPNIMIYFIDELRADALGCYGHPYVQTPHMDRIASEGIRFDQAFANCPLCMPSRNSFHTGLYPSEHGVMFNEITETVKAARTPCEFGTLLGRAGYKRIINVGKHHTGFSAGNSGYTESYPIHHLYGARPERAPEGADPARDQIVAVPGQSPNVIVGGDYPGPVEDTEPYRVADKALEVMDSLPEDEPWLLRASFIAPHTPVLTPKPYSSLYTEQLEDWRPARDVSGRIPLVREWNERRGFDRFTDEECRKIRSSYYGLVTLVDDQIGRLEERLRGMKSSRPLLTLLISDHGASICDHGGMQVKGPFDTPDISRIPFLLRYSEGESGRVYGGLVQTIDVLPTLAELLGTEPEGKLSGRSLAPILFGSGEPVHEAVYAEGTFPPAHIGVRESIRTSAYLYTRYPELGQAELFDLAADPGTTRNRIGEEPDTALELDRRLSEWRAAHPLP